MYLLQCFRSRVIALLLMAFGAFSWASMHLQVASRTGSLSFGIMRNLIERDLSHLTDLLVVQVTSVTLGIFARVVTLRAIHIHVRVVRKQYLAEACGVSHFRRWISRRRGCSFIVFFRIRRICLRGI